MERRELTAEEIKDSQELVGALMDIINNWFLEKSPNIIVLEIRRILTMYDAEWHRERDYPPKPWQRHPSAYLWYK